MTKMTKMTKNNLWLNIYEFNGNFVFGSDLYATPTEATKDLADKEHYSHTINVLTGDIVEVDIFPKELCNAKS